MAMAPTRKDLSEAREAKLSNIDAIVRAKLGIASPTKETRTEVDILSQYGVG